MNELFCERGQLIHLKRSAICSQIGNVAHTYSRTLLSFECTRCGCVGTIACCVFLPDPMFVSENPVLKWNGMWANGLWADTAAGALGICGLGCGFRRSDCSKQERQVAYGTGSWYCVVVVWLWEFLSSITMWVTLPFRVWSLLSRVHCCDSFPMSLSQCTVILDCVTLLYN